MITLPTCPVCNGRRMHLLRYDHSNVCTLRTAEDSRADADRQALLASMGAPVTRQATPAEVLLGVPADATVTVSAGSAGLAIVNRSW